MKDYKDIRHGRHCIFNIHIHLVFVTKYRRQVFDGDAIKQLRTIFTKVCADFEATLVGMDGGDDHVHLLVEYPPKVSVSSLVNSLKGVSSRLRRQRATRHRETLLEGRALVAVLLCLILRRCTDLHCAPVHRTAADTSLNSQPQGRLRRVGSGTGAVAHQDAGLSVSGVPPFVPV